VLDDSVIAESLTGLARRSLPALDLQGEVPLEGETNISEWWPR
jgi:hypothetical protein